MARVRPMGVNRFVSTAIHDLRYRLGQRPSEPSQAGSAGDLAVDELEIKRRRSERSSFADDAAYFDFLISRAVQASHAEQVRPETW